MWAKASISPQCSGTVADTPSEPPADPPASCAVEKARRHPSDCTPPRLKCDARVGVGRQARRAAPVKALQSRVISGVCRVPEPILFEPLNEL